MKIKNKNLEMTVRLYFDKKFPLKISWVLKHNLYG